MREIKFRVWNGYRMLSDETLRKNAEEMYTKLGIRSQYMDDIMIPNNKDLVVMQYTGLKDKNGKEIYEGDIVRIEFHEFHDYDLSEGFIGTVCYDEAMYTVDKDRESYRLFDELDNNEVLGNIYENKELLG